VEGLMRHFIKNMSKEEKLKMAREFMNSLSDEEKAEMIQLMLPMMMSKDFSENDCRKMMMEMPSEMLQQCKKMMTQCLKICEEIERKSLQ